MSVESRAWKREKAEIARRANSPWWRLWYRLNRPIRGPSVEFWWRLAAKRFTHAQLREEAMKKQGTALMRALHAANRISGRGYEVRVLLSGPHLWVEVDQGTRLRRTTGEHFYVRAVPNKSGYRPKVLE